MKVIGIMGSPRKGGNTEIMLAHALTAAKEGGLETEMIRLSEMDIRPCKSCGTCNTAETCSIKDDLMPLYEKIKAAEAVILASPVYVGSATALMRAFMERAGIIAIRNNRKFGGKVGGAIVVARRAGQSFTFAEMTLWFHVNNMIVPGSTYWNIGIGRNPGEVANDEEGMRTVRVFGKNVALVTTKMNA